MMLACLTSAQVQITEAQALQLVKNHYPQNSKFDFYIAEIDSIFDDGDDSCIIDTIPQITWLSSKCPKWLVFVDERPMTGWSHPCSYFFIPKNYSPINDETIPCVKFKGTKYPRKIKLTLLESQREIVNKQATPNIHLSRNYSISSHQRIDDYDEPIVIIIGGGYEEENNYLTYWNDCEYLYNVLTQDYGYDPYCFLSFFPTFQLRTYEGVETYINRPSYYNNEQPWYPLMYLNRKDIILEKLYDFYLIEENPPYKDSNLIFYITCHGDIDPSTNEPYICLLDMSDYLQYPSARDNRLYATELDSIASLFGARNTTFILQNCYSGAFIDYLQGPGRTIITACSEDESSWSMDPHLGIEHNEFSYDFTNAIHQADKFGNPINSDTDSNGHITMEEAFLYAQSHDENDETPMYSSAPEWLGQEFSFDITPDTANLYVRDHLQDVGSNIHVSSGTFWNSPDIWVRNDDDGFYYKENDHLLVGSDEKLYIYVRVNNRGYRNYVDPSKYLHLYWKKNSLNMSRDAIFAAGSPYGGKITTLSLDTAIAVDTSCIYRYVWQLPSTLVSRAASNGSILDIEVLALVNDSTTSVIPEDAGGTIALRENSNVAMRKENTILPSLGVYDDGGGMMMYQAKRIVKIPIYVNAVDNNGISNITLVSDSLSSGNSFSLCNYYLELSPGIYNLSSNLSRTNITTTNSAPRKYKLNAAGSSFEFKVPQNVVDSLIFYCEYNNRAPISDINHILHLKMTNSSDSLIDVESYTVKIEAQNGLGPGIIMLNGSDGSCKLVATDVSEPSRLEWYGPQCDLIGEGDTLCLNANRQQGEYTLRAASEKTGAVAYATAIINDDSGIESISPNPFNGQFTVHLTHSAGANTVIRMSPINGSGRVAEYSVTAGEQEVTVSAENCQSGIYIVSLIENGILTGSSRIIKN